MCGKSNCKPGYPRFKGKNRCRSFGFKEEGNGFRIDGRHLKLTGVGRVAVRWHRPLEGKIKTVRIGAKAGKWYASFACEVEAAPLPPLETEVGIDAGLSSLFVLSDGTKIENPRWYRNSQRKLRPVSATCRRPQEEGRQQSPRGQVDVGSLLRTRRRRRKDFLNKLVRWMVSGFGRIALEDLLIDRMVHGHLAKSILDAGWGYFRLHLLSKAANAGRRVVWLNPALHVPGLLRVRPTAEALSQGSLVFVSVRQLRDEGRKRRNEHSSAGTQPVGRQAPRGGVKPKKPPDLKSERSVTSRTKRPIHHAIVAA